MTAGGPDIFTAVSVYLDVHLAEAETRQRTSPAHGDLATCVILPPCVMLSLTRCHGVARLAAGKAATRHGMSEVRRST
jgi:hypothetical protein